MEGKELRWTKMAAICAAALLLRADGETVTVFSGAARLGLV